MRSSRARQEKAGISLPLPCNCDLIDGPDIALSGKTSSFLNFDHLGCSNRMELHGYLNPLGGKSTAILNEERLQCQTAKRQAFQREIKRSWDKDHSQPLNYFHHAQKKKCMFISATSGTSIVKQIKYGLSLLHFFNLLQFYCQANRHPIEYIVWVSWVSFYST